MSETFDPYYTWLGIPPQQQPPNHYRLLGVELFEGNPDVIERAADRCMADLRTHQAGKHSAASQKLLNQVAAARVCLLDERKKSEYDISLREVRADPTSKATEADMFTSLVEAVSPASPTSVRRRAKPKADARIVGAATAGLAIVLIAAWFVLSGSKASDEPQDVARAERPAPATSSKETGVPAKGAGETSPSSDVSPVPPENSPKKADELGQPDGGQMPPAVTAAAAPAPEVSKKADAPVPPTGAAQPPAAGPEPKTAAEKLNRPIPSTEVQRQAGETIEQAYNISQAKTAEEKLKLAKELLEAAKSTSKPDEQYVILRKAAELACDAGDAILMLQILGPLTDGFVIDSLGAKAIMLERFAKGPRSPARVQALVEGSRGVIEEAIADDRFEIASSIAKVALDACSRSAPQVRKEAANRRKKVQHLQERFAEVRKALDCLKSNPEDADANATAGAWYCLIKDDWKTGLPHLAKGSDPVLKRLALRELTSPPAGPEDQVRLADAWWVAAEDRREDENIAFLRCAGHWYEQAVGRLEGVDRKRVEKRLAQIAELDQESAPRNAREPALAIAPFDAKQARWFQKRWARYLSVPVEFTNAIGIRFVLIPPGEFDMGSSQQEIDRLLSSAKQQGVQGYLDQPGSEVPQHRVKIGQAFYLGVCEITQAQYTQVTGVNPSHFKQGDCPVERVSWDEATAFCRRLSTARGEKIAAGEYRLPTEAEWEYACRAGTATRRCFDDSEAELLDHAWTGANADSRTHPVGQKSPNPFGLYDVYGNVWEWCSDVFSADYYRQSPSASPTGPAEGAKRVYRGGSSSGDPPQIVFRSAFRGQASPDYRWSTLGFRLVRTVARQPTSSKEPPRPEESSRQPGG